MFQVITARSFLFVILVVSVAALAFAMISQYVFGFEPCLLCRYQRIPYWTAIALTLTSLVVPGVDRRGVVWTIAFVFAVSTALAFYHVGVEQHWWKAGACAAQGGLSLSFDDFRATPLAPIAKTCDTVDWTLFGLSMASYNVALSAVLALGAIVFARSIKRG